LRRWGTGLLAASSCLLIVVSAVIVWSHQTVLDTNGFVSTVAPVIKDPGVAQAMSHKLTQQISSTVDLEAKVENALPPVAKPLVTSIASTVRSFVESRVTQVLLSPQFYTLWKSVLAFTHHQVLAALRGQTSSLHVTKDEVVLDALPIVNEALKKVQSEASGILGHNVKLPTITSGTVPAKARAELSKALGVPVPADFGHIVLLRSSSIKLAKNSVSLFDLLVWLVPLVTALVLVASVAISVDRRRTLLQIAVATIVLLVLTRRLATRLVSDLAHQATNQLVASSILHQLLAGFFDVLAWMLVVASVIGVILLLAGPYRWARWLRADMAHLAKSIGHGVADVAEAVVGVATRDDAAVKWIVAHRALLQGAGAVVGAILLFVVPFLWFLVVLAILALYELALARLSVPSRARPAASESS
jgi:hypothetical protein